MGSTGPILFPTPSSGAQLLVQQGKQGTIYLVNRNNLGKDCASASSPCTGTDTQIPQELRGATPGVLSSPVYWNGYVYWPSYSYLYSWTVDPNTGLISSSPSSPSSQSAQTFARTAAASLSASGTTNGILWLMQNTSEIFAFDATNLSNILWTSAQAPGGRDSAGSAVKFAPPTIVNGKVYVGTNTAAVAYGLLGGTVSSAATPSFSPGGGTYTSPQSVTISDSTPSATVYYTTNGTTPTTASTVYSGPITVNTSETVEAIAVASGVTNSAVGSATYTIQQSGGTTATTASAVYTGPISVSASETLEAIAVASGQTASAVATAAYTINTTGGGTGGGGSGTPAVSYPSGFASATGFTLDGGATVTGGACS